MRKPIIINYCLKHNFQANKETNQKDVKCFWLCNGICPKTYRYVPPPLPPPLPPSLSPSLSLSQFISLSFFLLLSLLSISLSISLYFFLLIFFLVGEEGVEWGLLFVSLPDFIIFYHEIFQRQKQTFAVFISTNNHAFINVVQRALCICGTASTLHSHSSHNKLSYSSLISVPAVRVTAAKFLLNELSRYV